MQFGVQTEQRGHVSLGRRADIDLHPASVGTIQGPKTVTVRDVMTGNPACSCPQTRITVSVEPEFPMTAGITAPSATHAAAHSTPCPQLTHDYRPSQVVTLGS
jgi:hypothetical protein